MNSNRQISVSASACQPKKSMVLPDSPGRAGEDGLEIGGLEQQVDGENAERKTEIADAVDHEGLDRRRVRRRLLIPETDQEVAGETDALPAEEQLDQIVRGHQHQHREGEQAEIAEEARPVRILVHVADGIEVHERGDGVDHHQHHGGQRVDAERPRHLQIAGIDPGKQRDPDDITVQEADIDQHQPGECCGNEQKSRGNELSRARTLRRRFGDVVVVVAVVVMGISGMRVIAMPVLVMFDHIAARVARMRPEDRDQAGQNGAQQRQKDDCLNHSCFSPSSD